MVPCETTEWAIKVPNGKFEVKVIVGDPGFKTGYWISVNGNAYMKGTVLYKNQFWTPSKVIHVSDKIIKITGECFSTDCENVWSRISAVEIFQVSG